MLTRRRSYKGGTKTKRNDIIDTSELEKPKIFSIKDVHNLFFKNQEESKTEYKDENQAEIDDYVANSKVDYDDEIEEQPLSEEDQLAFQELAIKSDSEEEDGENTASEQEDDESTNFNDDLKDLVADVIAEDALNAAQKELQEEFKKELEIDEEIRQDNANTFHKVFVSSSKEEDMMNRAYIGRNMKSLSDMELLNHYTTSEHILEKLHTFFKQNPITSETSQIDKDNYSEMFKRFEWVNNYSAQEIFKRVIIKMENKSLSNLLNWLNDDTNHDKKIPHELFARMFHWDADRYTIINLVKHEKYTREMKEIQTSEDLNILYNFIHSTEHKSELEKTHLAKDVGLLTAIWNREYKNKFLKEELAKGRRYEDILDQLQSDLRPSGFEESKVDSDEEMYA